MQRTEKRGLFSVPRVFLRCGLQRTQSSQSVYSRRCKNSAVYGVCQPQTTTSCISMVNRASGCQTLAISLWKPRKGLSDAVSRGGICPISSADAAFMPSSVLKYKPSPHREGGQGAETVHLALVSCAKSHKMWRRRTLLLRYGFPGSIAGWRTIRIGFSA